MIALSPRPRAASAYSNIRSGVRWAETTLASKGTPKSSSIFAAAFIVGQSELEPMMMPTTGWVSFISQSSLAGRELAIARGAFGGNHGVFQQHGDGHRPHAARHRGDRASDFPGRLEI